MNHIKKVAVAQVAPVFLNKKATIEKACKGNIKVLKITKSQRKKHPAPPAMIPMACKIIPT